ncbi:MAG: hypothetical protein KatS3mg057_2756 [Herpetosiphonaceae bacterium]|nr:MAG: hypothetical protein KatS3mg057_2756 [Herpetosiphonaceae bacterium]
MQPSERTAYAWLIQSMGDALIATDASLRIRVWNRAAEALYGWQAKEVQGRSVGEVIPILGCLDTVHDPDQLCTFSLHASWRAVVMQCGRDSAALQVDLSGQPIRDGQGSPVGLVVVSRPIARYPQTEVLYQELLEAVPDALLVLNDDGAVAVINSQAQQLFGYKPSEIVGRPLEVLFPAWRQKESGDQRAALINPGGMEQGSGVEVMARRKDGSEFAADIRMNTISIGGALLVIVAIHDMTDRRRMEQELRHTALHDPLTGLYNRRYVDESLERELARASRSGRALTVMMLDLDHFKELNDSLGHPAGDMLLREVGLILQRSTRRGDIACRYGGDEFLLLLPETPLEDALRRADDLRRRIDELARNRQPSALQPVTVSIGVAIFPDHALTAGGLIAAADAALYGAKVAGRDRVMIACDSDNAALPAPSDGRR